MSQRTRRAVWGLAAAGTVIRIVLAFTTDGQPYDIESLRLVRHALGHAPLHAYAALDMPGTGYRWPYPAGYFPFLGLSVVASHVTGLAYTSLLRIPSILADAGIALIVQDFIGRRGASERQRIAATALIALGPSFIAISGYHGQIDSTAILPAVAALAVWDRAPESRRALYAGLLIGLGASVKTTPIFMLLALIPAARSWRERTTLVAASAVIPVVVTAPFFLTTPHEVVHALGYRGFPGTSGLSLLLQPGLGKGLAHHVTPNGVVQFLYDHGQVLVVATLLAVTVATWRVRPVERAALLWLALYIVTPVFFFQYLVWGLPFLLMAGRLRLALAVQAVALAPTIMFYLAPYKSDGIWVAYAAVMVALWCLYVLSFAFIARARAPAT